MQPRYRSGENDVVRDFYVPMFNSAETYSRAVGYFTSTSLALLSRGVDAFWERGGRMRVVASPRLELDDISDISRGYEVRAVMERATVRALEAETDESVLAGLGALGRLIASGHLDIKLAFFTSAQGFGLYHEKIGYFRDADGDVVAFTGSANETYGGLLANFESIDVYRSWVPGDDQRALRLAKDFDALWADETPTLTVWPFPDVARDKLVQLATDRSDVVVPPTDQGLQLLVQPHPSVTGFLTPSGLQPRDYQQEAIRRWLAQRGRGVLKMATGTGKTKTALLAAARIVRVHAEREEPVAIVIVAPYQHLVDQWVQEVQEFGTTPIAVYESSRRWVGEVEEAMGDIRLGIRKSAVFVTTSASLALAPFQSFLSRLHCPLMFIGDEVHNLGSEGMLASLPANATYRLGLSATPERFMDEQGTLALLNYFGPIVFELGMQEAIEMGALCRYDYFPRLIELDDDETDLYLALTAQIAPLLAGAASLDDVAAESPLGHLLRKRSNVLGHARGKLEAFKADAGLHAKDWYQLAYCAEGGRPSDAIGAQAGDRQIDDVIRILGNQLRLASHTYVSQTPREERRALLRRFQTGDDLRFLVAMRCLDEGVDIPDARIAYILASSSNPRQFIQRRGRLLRQPPSGAKKALIYDYLAVPAKRGFEEASEIERNLVRRELERAIEFSALSDNYEESLRALRPVKTRFQLMDM